MHFVTVAALLAAAGTALGQTTGYISNHKPASGEKVPAGSTYTIEWTITDQFLSGSVDIKLIGGSSQQTLRTIAQIATGVKNSALKYDWAVDASLGAETIYGFNFTDTADPRNIFQYSNPFSIVGGATGGNTTVTSTSSSGTATRTLTSVTGSASTTGSADGETTTSARRTVTSVVTAGSQPTTSTTRTGNGGVRPTAGAIAGLAGFALAALAL